MANKQLLQSAGDGTAIPAGAVGQQIEGTTSSPATAAAGAWVNIGSIPLTAGVWLVYGSTSFYLNGTLAGPSYCQLLIGATSASSTGSVSISWFGCPSIGGNYSGTTVMGYLTISTSATYYLNLSTQYTSASGGGGVTAPRFYAVRIA